MNKYHLHVYKFSDLTFKEIWDAPFKDDESLIKAILDYTGRGFTCSVTEYK